VLQEDITKTLLQLNEEKYRLLRELKRFEVHIDSAYKKNYSDYLDTIPHLFHWNALVVISNGHDAQYGSLTSTREHFYR
jgi:type I restriction enzyme R subunit